MLHGKRLTPYRAIWTLAAISAVIGILTVSNYLGGTTPAALEEKYKNIWYSFGLFNPAPSFPALCGDRVRPFDARQCD